jgi:hypothetical protein
MVGCERRSKKSNAKISRATLPNNAADTVGARITIP